MLPAHPDPLLFCGGEHYVAWWSRAHRDETAEYPWLLHEAMFDARRRASGRDAPQGIREWLLLRLGSWRGGGS